MNRGTCAKLSSKYAHIGGVDTVCCLGTCFEQLGNQGAGRHCSLQKRLVSRRVLSKALGSSPPLSTLCHCSNCFLHLGPGAHSLCRLLSLRGSCPPDLGTHRTPFPPPRLCRAKPASFVSVLGALLRAWHTAGAQRVFTERMSAEDPRMALALGQNRRGCPLAPGSLLPTRYPIHQQDQCSPFRIIPNLSCPVALQASITSCLVAKQPSSLAPGMHPAPYGVFCLRQIRGVSEQEPEASQCSQGPTRPASPHLPDLPALPFLLSSAPAALVLTVPRPP